MTEIDFTRRMGQVQDEELLTIVSSDGFLPAAVDAAKAEIERRNLAPDELNRMTADIKERQFLDQNKSLIPLGTGGKIAALFVGPYMVVVLRFTGYRRKSIDALIWTGIGLGFWFALGLIIAFISD